jgi:UDP-N-acetylglucosamine acyltransferase
VGIHPTAIIDPKTELGANVEVGPYTVIGPGNKIGDNTVIGPQVLIEKNTTIGKNCRIFKGASIGCVPQDLKFGNEESVIRIGDSTTIREFVTIHRATKHTMLTAVGSNCLLMAYVHIAHDCAVGSNVIIGNATQISGHVTVEDWAILSGLIPVHQFVRIGQHCYIGGGYRVPQDVPPYVLAAGEPLAYTGINSVGLERRGFKAETVEAVKKAYRILYRSKLKRADALAKIKSELGQVPEVRNVVEFVEKSERGII